jgi:hypothetical protein
VPIDSASITFADQFSIVLDVAGSRSRSVRTRPWWWPTGSRRDRSSSFFTVQGCCAIFGGSHRHVVN